MRWIIATLSACVLLFSGCAQPATTVAANKDLAADESAIRAADARWLKAAKERDAAGEGAVFAADGVAYREHLNPLVGPKAVEAFADKFRTDNSKSTTTWSTDVITIAASGDLATQTGEYHMTGLGPAGDREDKGRFLTVWKKVNGEWRVAHDIGSTTMPEAATLKK